MSFDTKARHAIFSAIAAGDFEQAVEIVAREADVREDEARDVLRVLGIIR